jgi:hypothetical protein
MAQIYKVASKEVPPTDEQIAIGRKELQAMMLRLSQLEEAFTSAQEREAKLLEANAKADLQHEAVRANAFAHGHAHAMAKAWRYLVGGAIAGFLAAVLTYGVASLNGGYLASMERKNDEIRRMLDQ